MSWQILEPWAHFALCLLLIGFAGVKLSFFGDVIADKTGLGGNWVGLVMLATVTSLPELVTGLTSVTVADLPDIAVGNIFGACVFNLTIIVVLDFLVRGQSVYRQAGQGHILSAGFGVLLIAIPGLNILLAQNGAQLRVAHVGLYTPAIMLLYAVAVRTLFRYESQHVREITEQEPDQRPDLTLRQAVLRYLAAAVAVVATAVWLPFVAARLAAQMGWHESLMGTLMVPAVTSMPELVVSVAALRLGALDMAISSLLGSNLFNIFILALDDLLYLRGPLLSHVSPVHAVSALSAMAMTGVAIVGLFYRAPERVLHTVGWSSLLLFSLYLLNGYAAFHFGH